MPSMDPSSPMGRTVVGMPPALHGLQGDPHAHGSASPPEMNHVVVDGGALHHPGATRIDHIRDNRGGGGYRGHPSAYGGAPYGYPPYSGYPPPGLPPSAYGGGPPSHSPPHGHGYGGHGGGGGGGGGGPPGFSPHGPPPPHARGYSSPSYHVHGVPPPQHRSPSMYGYGASAAYADGPPVGAPPGSSKGGVSVSANGASTSPTAGASGYTIRSALDSHGPGRTESMSPFRGAPRGAASSVGSQNTRGTPGGNQRNASPLSTRGRVKSPEQQQQQHQHPSKVAEQLETERLRQAALTEISPSQVAPIKTAFHFYLQDVRKTVQKEAEAEIDSMDDTKSSQKSDRKLLINTNMNARLMKGWEQLMEEEREAYQTKEETDRRRFMDEEEIASRHCATLTARSKSPKTPERKTIATEARTTSAASNTGASSVSPGDQARAQTPLNASPNSNSSKRMISSPQPHEERENDTDEKDYIVKGTDADDGEYKRPSPASKYKQQRGSPPKRNRTEPPVANGEQ